MLHSMLDFPENKEPSRKLKKVQELVQHFREQYRYNVSKQNITYKHWWEFEKKWRIKKGKRKTVVYTNLKKTSAKYGLVLCGL